MERRTNITIGIIWTVIWIALGGYFQSTDSGIMHVIAWFFFFMAGSSVVYIFFGFSANETALEFINKNLGVKINVSQDMAFALSNEGQRLAREMDMHSFERPRNHIYDSPYTLIGEFNALVEIFEYSEDEKYLELVCEGIILAFNKYKNEFNECRARIYLNAPTDLLLKSQKKLNLPGIYG